MNGTMSRQFKSSCPTLYGRLPIDLVLRLDSIANVRGLLKRRVPRCRGIMAMWQDLSGWTRGGEAKPKRGVCPGCHRLVAPEFPVRYARSRGSCPDATLLRSTLIFKRFPSLGKPHFYSGSLSKERSSITD